MTVELEPLRPFSPLGEGDFRSHAVVVAAPANGTRVVECLQEAEMGVGDVVEDGGEVVERDA